MSRDPGTRPPAVPDEAVAETLLRLVAARGAGKTICPSEAARALAGNDPERWSRLMPAIRRVAVGLMKENRVVIRRKGRPVDPDDFRGVYRLSVPDDPAGTAASAGPGEGAGNSASVRPASR